MTNLSGVSRMVVHLRSLGKREPQITKQVATLLKNCPECVAVLAETFNEGESPKAGKVSPCVYYGYPLSLFTGHSAI